MLNALHPGQQCLIGSLVAGAVGGNVGMMPPCLVHHGTQLLRGKLHIVNPIRGGRHAAGGADLDELGAGAELFPHRLHAAIHPIAAHGQVIMSIIVGNGLIRAKIHMAGGNAQHLAAGHNARTPNDAPVNAPAYVQPGFTHVPQAGKACIQQQPCLIHRADHLIPQQGTIGEGACVLCTHQMGMHVHKAGQQGAFPCLQHLCVICRAAGCIPCINNLIFLYQHGGVLDDLTGLDIDHPPLQHQLSHKAPPSMKTRRIQHLMTSLS